MKQIILLISVLFIISCNKGEKQEEKADNDHLLMATAFQQLSPEYKAITLQSYKLAKYKLQGILLFNDSVNNKAIVLDIDETVLDNSPFQAKCIIENTNYPKYWNEWVAKEDAKLVPGVKEFLNYADSTGFEIFYISNRKHKHLQATINNLKKHKLPKADSSHILLRKETSSKTERRKKVSEVYEIALLIGDNLNDFSGEFEIEENGKRIAKVFEMKDNFVDKFIILPNPMYGEWEGALLNGNYDYSKYERDSVLISKLESFKP